MFMQLCLYCVLPAHIDFQYVFGTGGREWDCSDLMCDGTLVQCCIPLRFGLALYEGVEQCSDAIQISGKNSEILVSK